MRKFTLFYHTRKGLISHLLAGNSNTLNLAIHVFADGIRMLSSKPAILT